MAAGYNPSSIIGGPIGSGSLDQLKAREELYRSKENRSTQQLLYLNSKTGWVKLSSSVNRLNSDKADDETGTSTSAKNNVLFGGTFKDGSSDPKSGINLGGVSSNTAYNKYESTGFRPMPGINSFKIDSKNRFGTLREAVVDFQVWSVEQLSEFESLYLRPGFTVLLEWGHSIYLKNNGKVQSTTPLTIPDYFTGSQTKEKISEKIQELKDSSNNNYDAVFGYIKNFVWSYRGDGGYDCKLTIISAGELIESVKVHLSTNQSGDNPDQTQQESEKNKTPLHNILTAVKESDVKLRDSILPVTSTIEENNSRIEQGFLAGNREISKAVTSAAPNTIERFKKEIYNFRPKLPEDINFPVISSPLKADTNENGETVGANSINYIKIQDLLALINVTYLLAEKGKEESTKLFSFDLDPKKSLFYTFPDHLALDLDVAVLPKVSTKDEILRYGISNSIQVRKSISEIREDTYDFMAQEKIEISDRSILNIFLSVNYILNTLDSVLAQGKNSATVLNFVESLLSGLGRTMGGINSFGLHYEEDEFKYYLVDRKLTPAKKHLSKSKINLTGLRATVTNISMTSKLSPNIASMIAISAQASGTDVGEDTENMFRWNQGLVDRIVGKKGFVQTDLQDKKRQILNSIDQLQVAIKPFSNTDGLIDSAAYIKGQFIDLETTHYDVMQYLSKRYNNSQVEAGAPGIIPFDLDITLDGIGGIKIGQAFTINPGILPKKYDDVVGFIITGISHTVQNNKWNTDLKAQTIIIGKAQGAAEKYEDDLLTDEELEAALSGAQIVGDPSIPCKILDNEDINKVPAYDTYGTVITPQQILERLNTTFEVQQRFLGFFTELAETYHEYVIYINATFRPLERSLSLKQTNPKNAYPGKSDHNYGTAIDMQVDLPGGGITLGKEGSKSLWRRTGIPDLAARHGIEWGGDFKNYNDDVHFYLGPKSISAVVRPDETVSLENDRYANTAIIDWSPQKSFEYLFTDAKFTSYADRYRQGPAIKTITTNSSPSINNVYEVEDIKKIVRFELTVKNIDLKKYMLSRDALVRVGPFQDKSKSYYIK